MNRRQFIKLFPTVSLCALVLPHTPSQVKQLNNDFNIVTDSGVLLTNHAGETWFCNDFYSSSVPTWIRVPDKLQEIK